MEKLFETHKIGKKMIQNRVAVPPMVSDFPREDGYVVDADIEHYRAFAKGGAGLIIQEATCISPTGRLMKNQLGIWKDEQIDGLKQITSAVHKEGGTILVQIQHAGIVTVGDILDCPSDFETTLRDGRIVAAKEMSAARISLIQNQFIEAGRRAFFAGYDGIELHGAHGQLIGQFLNCQVNKRTDAYGKQPSLFAIEVLKGIRELVNDDFILGIRFGGFEPMLEQSIAHAKELQPYVDYLNVSSGVPHQTMQYKPEGYGFTELIYAAQKIKEAVSVPVFTVGGITSPQQAEDILKKTNADMVCIGRESLHKPNWTNDAMHLMS